VVLLFESDICIVYTAFVLRGSSPLMIGVLFSVVLFLSTNHG